MKHTSRTEKTEMGHIRLENGEFHRIADVVAAEIMNLRAEVQKLRNQDDEREVEVASLKLKLKRRKQ